MSLLEEKIKKNKDLFDGAEPPEGHFDRFQEKLDILHPTGPLYRKWYATKMFRVAAVVAVLLGLSVTYYVIDPKEHANHLSANALPQEIQEARMYYDKLTEEKLEKINDCASSGAEASYIQKEVDKQISILDSNSVELENQLKADTQNKRVKNALLRNYKTKSDILDDILNRLCHI